MKKILLILVGALCALSSDAQEDNPLAVTLPNGKVVRFETQEQKEKFVAARERVAAATLTPAAASSGAPAMVSNGMGHTAADVIPAMGGKVNVNAPTFTAEYYLFAPETWVDKPVTLSVAYIRRQESSRPDGLVELRANTYGTLQGTGEQQQGGFLTIVATPAAAQRIMTLAGTRYQYGNGWGTKTTLFKGTFKKSEVGSKGYFLYVDQ